MLKNKHIVITVYVHVKIHVIVIIARIHVKIHVTVITVYIQVKLQHVTVITVYTHIKTVTEIVNMMKRENGVGRMDKSAT